MKLMPAIVCFALLAACGPRGISVRSAGTADGAATHAAAALPWPALDRWSPTNEAPSDVAVIVAIEDYAFLPDVAGAARNAADWEAWFRSRGMKEVYVLTDDKAASEEMLRYAEVVAAAAPAKSRLWYVFIGHGAPAVDGKDGVLVGMDARQSPDSLTARGVRQGELLARLEKGRQAETIVVLDACFSGQSGDGQALARGTQPVLAVTPTLGLRKGTVVMSAAKSDQFAGALPTADRPAYSYLLLGALRGWADEGDGRLTAGAANQFVEMQLRHVTGRTQTPQVTGNADTLLTVNAREADPGIAQRMQGRGQGADTSGVAARVDTGAGVVIVPLDDWTPDRVSGGALASYKRDDDNYQSWNLWGFRDPNGQSQAWINNFHQKYAQIEDQIRPTQVIEYNGISTFETAYEANVKGTIVTIYVWDIQRPGAYYRAVGFSWDSPTHGAKDYKQFQAWLGRLQFGSAANAPRLLDNVPGVLGKLSQKDDSQAEEYAEIPMLTTGMENFPLRDGDRENGVVRAYQNNDTAVYMVSKLLYQNTDAAWRASNAYFNQTEGVIMVAPTGVTWGENDGWYGEYQHVVTRDNRQVTRRELVFRRVSGRTLWTFTLYIDADRREAYAPLFSQMISNTRFYQ